MRTLIIAILLVATAISLTGQAHDHSAILQTDSTWGHEFFEFPIRFAQDIPYEGIEDATFPRGWSDQKSEEFWSYVFAWDISHEESFNAKIIERDLQIYFDGLMKLNHENKDNTEVKQTSSKFYKIPSNDDVLRFKGKLRTLNAFHTQKAFTLNVTVEQHICSLQQRSLIVFRFSPRDFDETIWVKLNAIKLVEPICPKNEK